MRINYRRSQNSLRVLMFVLCLAICIYTNYEASATSSLPTFSKTINQTQLFLPDWTNIAFVNFPKIAFDGKVELQGEIRTWKKGQTPDQFLTLQDISVLFPNLLNLSLIMEGTKLEKIVDTPLSNFALVDAQTIDYLATIVPGLSKTKVKNVPPIYELFKSVLKEKITDVDNLALSEALDIVPSLGDLTLNAINLEKFSLSTLENLETVELGKFKNWEKAYINQIPGLNKLPLALYPVPLTARGEDFGFVKFIWNNQEKEVIKTISGSYNVGFSYPCLEQQCANVEVSFNRNNKTAKKASWVWGKQLVEGGNGCLININDGKEATGRNPYGSLFKVVINQIDDKSDKVSTALYFRLINWCGVTPYIVGPIPFQEYGLNSYVFLGNDEADNFIKQQPVNLASETTNISNRRLSYDSINLKLLAQIIADYNNSSYDYVSDYLVAGDKKGRILGLYLFRSYDEAVIAAIESQPGGADWLKKISQGFEVDVTNRDKYFSSATQDDLFLKYLSNLKTQTEKEIDPTTGKLFIEKRLVSRILEKVYFGTSSLKPPVASPVDNLVNIYENKT